MNRTLQIAAPLAGSIFSFFVLSYILGFSLLLSILMALGVGAGLFLMTAPSKIDPRDIELEQTGVSKKEFQKILRAVSLTVKRMKELSSSIYNGDVKTRFDRIISLTEDIYEDLKMDPKDVKPARRFLNYYLDTTVSIVERYTTLENQHSSEANITTLNKVEELLDNMERAFQKQLSKLYDDDFLYLDSEIDFLERSLKMDGLHEKRRI